MPHTLEIQVSDEAYDGLQELKSDLNKPNMLEVIQEALRLLYWAEKEMQKGAEICSINKRKRLKTVLAPFNQVPKTR